MSIRAEETSGPVFWVETLTKRVNYGEFPVVSLSPEASHALRSLGINYARLEDDGPDFRSFESAYFDELLQQLDKLDDLLVEKLPYADACELRIFRNHWLRIKTLFDALIVLSRRMNTYLERVRPSEIRYSAAEPPSSVRNYSLMALNDNTRRFVRPMALLCARQQEIPILFEAGSAASEKAAVTSAARSSTLVAARRPESTGHANPLRTALKSAKYFSKYGKISRLWTGDSTASHVRAYFTALGSMDMDPVAKDLMNRGATVYLNENGCVHEVSGWRHKKIVDLPSLIDPQAKAKWTAGLEAVAVAIESNTSLFDWLAGYAGVDLKDIVLPYLQHFIRSRALEAVCEFESVRSFMRTQGVNAVVVRESTQYLNTMPLTAAASLGGVRRICFQHGGFLSESKIWRLSQTDLVDLYFAWGSESRDYTIREAATGPAPDCEVREYSHFFDGQRRPVRSAGRKETLFYLPTKAVTGIERLNMAVYPAVWYYDLQMAILEYLNTLTDRDVVLKYIGEGGGWFKSTVLDHVTKNLKNIRVISVHFSKCLSMADRVLMDIPSTALYQAAAARIPVMALYQEDSIIRESCKTYFGASLQPYRDIQDAVEQVRSFVCASPSNYGVERDFLGKPDPVRLIADRIRDSEMAVR